MSCTAVCLAGLFLLGLPDGSGARGETPKAAEARDNVPGGRAASQSCVQTSGPTTKSPPPSLGAVPAEPTSSRGLVMQVAAEVKPRRLRPTISSEWFRIVAYPQHHLNDFCLFRDQRGTWHAIGIMGKGTWASEQTLFHSTGASLDAPFANQRPLFEGMPEWIGRRGSANTAPQKHAPFVIYHEGVYHMFYRRPNGTNLHVQTHDPADWPNRVRLAFEEQDARDSCLVRIEGTFYHYSCQAMEVDGVWRGCVAVRVSKDLRRWSPAEPAHVDTSRVSKHSHMESPFVVVRPEGCYLFARNRRFDDPMLTTVYFSRDPKRFPSGEKAWFAEIENVHAPEIVRHENRYYLARTSGPPHANPKAPKLGGWIEVAELQFR